MLQLDPTTQAALEAAKTPTLRAAAILSSLSGAIDITVYDGSGNVKGSGTMASLGTQSGNVIVLGNTSDFEVTETGSPDPASWTIKFANGTGKYIIGTFGLSSQPASEFKWSLDNWTIGSTGSISNAYLTVKKNEVLSDVSASFKVTTSPTNTAPFWLGSTPSTIYVASGQTFNFAPYAGDLDGQVLTFTKVSGNGSISSSGVYTAGTTGGSLVVRVSDGALSADHTCTVSITGAVSVQALRDAGYKIADLDYPNIRINDSSFDSRAGIQAAIDECANLGYPLYFRSGTYYIGDTLWCDLWSPFSTRINPAKQHQYLIGCSTDRPVIKPLPTSTRFNNASRPVPLINYRTYQATTTSIPGTNDVYPTANPTDPWAPPTGWEDFHGCGFFQQLINFIIDTEGCVGAIGVHFGTCQNSWMHNVKVIGTGSRGSGAYCCFYGIGGCQGSTDLEGIGGRYGIMVGSFGFGDEQAGSGSTGVSIKLSGQTVAAIYARDYTPTGIVGFDITLPAGTKLVYSDPTLLNNPRSGNVYLVDGIVRCNGQTAIENAGVTMYARNVYVTGTNNVIKTGSLATVSAAGTWKRVVEYVAKNPNGVAESAITTYPQSAVKQHVIINGAFNTDQQPIANVTASASVPPSDLVSRHSPMDSIPFIDDGKPYVNVLDFGATRYYLYNNGANSMTGDWGKGFYNTSNAWVGSAPVDSWTAIKNAIDAAATAGHNRVLLPRGFYFLSQTLELKANTKLFGVGSKHSGLGAAWSWVPTTSPTYLVSTVDAASGAASLTSVMLDCPATRGTQDPITKIYSGDRFSKLRWRVGRRSLTWDTATDLSYNPYPNNDRSTYVFEGSGGGRHYFLESDGRGHCHVNYRGIKITGTTEPLSFYGPSLENSKLDKPSNWLEPANGGIAWDITNYSALTNVEITNAKNVRIYGNKREGNAGSYYIQNSSNILVFGPGVNGGTIQNKPDFARIKIYGDPALTNNIAVVQHTVQSANYAAQLGRKQLLEQITGQATISTPYWEGIAYYKRGEPDDTVMTHS